MLYAVFRLNCVQVGIHSRKLIRRLYYHVENVYLDLVLYHIVTGTKLQYLTAVYYVSVKRCLYQRCPILLFQCWVGDKLVK